MKDQLRIAVIGASGYTGGELLRLLSLHPQVNDYPGSGFK